MKTLRCPVSPHLPLHCINVFPRRMQVFWGKSSKPPPPAGDKIIRPYDCNLGLLDLGMVIRDDSFIASWGACTEADKGHAKNTTVKKKNTSKFFFHLKKCTIKKKIYY